MRTRIMIFSLLLAACGPQNGETPNSSPTPDTSAAATRVVGTVAVVGSAPVSTAVVVRDANGESVRIEGPMAGEIGRLSGAEVEVTGTRREDPMYGHSLQASGYRVVSVDGRPVVMGTVEMGERGRLQLRTNEGQIIRLAGGAGHLRAGQKVWVQGPTTVDVQTFGVVQP
ncbi:hypothetical protein BH23GEM3_BH23GEM3_23030 [soil metagenome]